MKEEKTSSEGALISLQSWIIDPNLDYPKGMHSRLNIYPRKSHCLGIKSSLIIVNINMCTIPFPEMACLMEHLINTNFKIKKRAHREQLKNTAWFRNQQKRKSMSDQYSSNRDC